MPHPDIEFAVNRSGGRETIYDTFDAAAGMAIAIAASSGGTVNIDVLIYSEKGAEAWGGYGAKEAYRLDPDASVFERITVAADIVGTVP